MVTRCLPFRKMTAQQQIDHMLLCHDIGSWAVTSGADVAATTRRIMHTAAHDDPPLWLIAHTHDKDPQ